MKRLKIMSSWVLVKAKQSVRIPGKRNFEFSKIEIRKAKFWHKLPPPQLLEKLPYELWLMIFEKNYSKCNLKGWYCDICFCDICECDKNYKKKHFKKTVIKELKKKVKKTYAKGKKAPKPKNIKKY
jgi:hypothetical protein